MGWRVRGVLFADYVRMIRGHKGVDWTVELAPEDHEYLHAHVEPDEWYPMATFERMGNAILRHVAAGQLEAVRMWGRFSVDALRAAQPELVAEGNPVETLRRFRVLRATYFDFDTLDLPVLYDGEAEVVIRYGMGMPAEEAASYQTMGFFERLLELSGATEIEADLRERSWAGAPRTLLRLSWRAV